MSDRWRCLCRPVCGDHKACRLNWLRLGRRPPIYFGADVALVSAGRGRRPGSAALWPAPSPRTAELGRGRRPELLRFGRGGPVDLGPDGGLGGEGVLVVLVLANRNCGQDGSAGDHGHRGYVGSGPKATTAWLWLR